MLSVTYAYTQINQKKVCNDSLLIKIDSLIQVNNAWLEHI